MSEKKSIYFCGDIHGELRKLVWTITERYKATNIDLVVCGDFGVGFGRPKSMDVMYSRVLKRLEKNDIRLYTIRGNHDDPAWFDGKHDYPRLKFLEDHELVNIAGWSIYPIGGATSIDKAARIEAQKKIKTKCFWEGEKIERVDKYPGRADIIVSHTAPISFEPVVLETVI
jgi:Icc-related predicted phosphoesterase